VFHQYGIFHPTQSILQGFLAFLMETKHYRSSIKFEYLFLVVKKSHKIEKIAD
jgi:hypothetical protein